MQRNPKHSNEKNSIRSMLKELGHIVSLRDEPQPSVFVDREASARFYGIAWPLVYVDVLAHFEFQIKHSVKLKSLTNE